MIMQATSYFIAVDLKVENLKILWVWAALPMTMENTHFLVTDWKDNLQVDSSWGLTFAQKIRRKEIYFENIFLTHCHTDHFLWFFNMLRTIRVDILKLNIYCSKEVEKNIRIISNLILKTSINNFFDDWTIRFINIDNLEEKNIWNFNLKLLNLNSTKMEQYWFLLEYNSKKILFFGDEAFRVMQRNDLEELSNIDYLICEWLIPESQSIAWWWKIDIDKMHHITARQAWRIVKKLNTKNLIIIHTKEIENRQELLKQDALSVFDGNVFVLEDGEEIEII